MKSRTKSFSIFFKRPRTPLLCPSVRPSTYLIVMPADSGSKNTKFDTTFIAVCVSSKEIISMGNQNSEVAESFLNLSLILFKVLT